ncbi:MAG: FAD-dependent oxidoreductase [Firmicutes bacterium]|nr:FAD-dependent oxidoreductase [Bacillota bacterium]
MDSIWNKDIKLPSFPQLEEDIHTDVLIVGGGLAGLLCAWNLSRANIDCILIEEDRLMHGVSGRTTAKITSQHGLIYEKLLKKLGSERAHMYWKVNEEALHIYRTLSKSADFDFQSQNSFVYTRDGNKELEEEQKACERLRIPSRLVSTLPLPFPITGALCFPDQAQFHPLKFASHIVRGLKIYEQTKAISFAGNLVETPKGTITANKIIIATHFPILNKHGSYFLKLYQQRSYVIALEGADNIDGMYLDSAENGLSVRSAGKWLLLGGGGHRTGKQGLGWTMPEAVAAKYYPKAQIAARWATQDCMTLDHLPYIGQYSKSTPNLYVATGFQKWGMTSSMVAAMILTDLVQEKENLYAPLFSPSRSMMHKQLFINAIDSTANLLRPTRPRCPHLGCALRWNPQEHSWDCPCHGSRFDRDGKRLNNPATADIKALKEPLED